MDENDLLFYVDESKKLEDAYTSLERAFFELKAKWETSHQTLQEIVAHMSEGLLFISQGGVITLFNSAAQDLLGFSGVPFLNTSFWEHFSDQLFGFSMRLALSELPATAHRRVIISLAEDKQIEVSSSAIGEKGILLLLSSRKERQALERSLQQSERLQELGEMAATLAHEIRNPLGGIEGFAQLLKRDLETPAHQKMIHAILQGTKILNQLVTQVLEYARPVQLCLAETELIPVVHEAIALATASFPAAKITLSYSRANSSLLLDAAQIKLILLNLVRNAMEAKASLIEMHIEGCTLTIRDNGEGISEKNLKKIFTPFFTTKTQGTGLGLAQSAAIVKAHGGVFEVASKEGEGAQFTVTFPG